MSIVPCWYTLGTANSNTCVSREGENEIGVGGEGSDGLFRFAMVVRVEHQMILLTKLGNSLRRRRPRFAVRW